VLVKEIDTTVVDCWLMVGFKSVKSNPKLSAIQLILIPRLMVPRLTRDVCS